MYFVKYHTKLISRLPFLLDWSIPQSRILDRCEILDSHLRPKATRSISEIKIMRMTLTIQKSAKL